MAKRCLPSRVNHTDDNGNNRPSKRTSKKLKHANNIISSLSPSVRKRRSVRLKIKNCNSFVNNSTESARIGHALRNPSVLIDINPNAEKHQRKQCRQTKSRQQNNIITIEDDSDVENETLKCNTCNVTRKELPKEIVVDGSSLALGCKSNNTDHFITIVQNENTPLPRKFPKRKATNLISTQSISKSARTNHKTRRSVLKHSVPTDHIITICDDNCLEDKISKSTYGARKGKRKSTDDVIVVSDEDVYPIKNTRNGKPSNIIEKSVTSSKRLSRSACRKLEILGGYTNKTQQSLLNDDIITIDDDNCVGSNILNSNIYSVKPITKKGLREIVIDGSALALGYTGGTEFSVEALRKAIDYFLKRGHKVKAFIPHFRLKSKQSSNQKLLKCLVKKNYVITTPSRLVKGKLIFCDTNRYIVQYAGLCDGIIVSTNDFKEIANGNSVLNNIIHTQLLVPKWINNKLKFENKPYGVNGSSLESFLKFP